MNEESTATSMMEETSGPASVRPNPHVLPARRTVFSPLALFRGRQLPWTLLVLLAALVMVGLGFWQLQRRAGRLARNAHIREGLAQPPVALTGTVNDPAALEFRHVTVRGVFDYANEILLRNRTRDGRPGYHVVTPLRIAGSDSAVLVDRGWIPYEQADPAARRAFQDHPSAEVYGIAHPSQKQPSSFAPADPPVGANGRLDAWFRVDVERIQQQTPYKLLPLYVEESPAAGAPDLPWRSEDLALDEGPHLSYAIQWFSFATILLAGYVVRAGRVVVPIASQNVPEHKP
jgi:surfeit locus 1 family protein